MESDGLETDQIGEELKVADDLVDKLSDNKMENSIE